MRRRKRPLALAGQPMERSGSASRSSSTASQLRFAIEPTLDGSWRTVCDSLTRRGWVRVPMPPRPGDAGSGANRLGEGWYAASSRMREKNERQAPNLVWALKVG